MAFTELFSELTLSHLAKVVVGALDALIPVQRKTSACGGKYLEKQ